MADKIIECVYCKKSIKLSNKQRHEKSKACVQARAKSDITIYTCNYCNMSFDDFNDKEEHETSKVCIVIYTCVHCGIELSDLNKKTKHEKNLQCDSKLLFEKFQLQLSFKDEEIESKDNEISNLRVFLNRKDAQIELLKKQVHMLAKQNNQKKHYNAINLIKYAPLKRCGESSHQLCKNTEYFYLDQEEENVCCNKHLFNINIQYTLKKPYDIHNILLYVRGYINSTLNKDYMLYDIDQYLKNIELTFSDNEGESTFDIDQILNIIINGLYYKYRQHHSSTLISGIRQLCN